jgi:hypothetical protein
MKNRCSQLSILQTDWASQALEQFQDQDEECPESCQGIYYLIDKTEKVKDKSPDAMNCIQHLSNMPFIEN